MRDDGHGSRTSDLAGNIFAASMSRHWRTVDGSTETAAVPHVPPAQQRAAPISDMAFPGLAHLKTAERNEAGVDKRGGVADLGDVRGVDSGLDVETLRFASVECSEGWMSKYGCGGD